MIPVEAIQKICNEMAELVSKNQDAYKATRDEWFKGTVHAYTESSRMLREVIAQYAPDNTRDISDHE